MLHCQSEYKAISVKAIRDQYLPINEEVLVLLGEVSLELANVVCARSQTQVQQERDRRRGFLP